MDEQTLEQQEYYLYIVKNYDIDEALSKSNLPDIDKNYIKDRFLSNDVDLKEKVEIINSLLKYYKIEYRRNDIVQNLTTGNGDFTLVPGFYFVEMVGGNGGCDALGPKNTTRRQNDFYFKNFIVENFFINSINNSYTLKFTTHFQWLYSSQVGSKYGTYEINNFGIFLHLEKEILEYTDSFEYIQLNGTINEKKFYDYSTITLNRTDTFFKKLNFNRLGVFSSSNASLYQKITLTKNLKNNNFENSSLYTIQKYQSLYDSYCNENIGENIASFSNMDIFTNIDDNNINVGHGGSPGIIKKILRIDDLTRFNYSIGEAGTTDESKNLSKDGKNTTLKSTNTTKFNLIAEGGKAALFDGSSWNYTFKDSNYNEVLKEKIGPDVETEFSCVSEVLNGNGIIQIDNNTQSFNGSNIDGQGIQLNDFETLYYSDEKNGYIKIKFLGPLSNSLCGLNISLGTGLSCSSFDTTIITNSSYSFLIKLNSRNDILDFTKSKINEIPIKSLLENNKINLKIKKYKNYYEFSFDCIKFSSFNFYFEKITKNYLFVEDFSDKAIKYDYINYINNDDFIKFYFHDDLTFNKNLLLLYNSLYDSDIIFDKNNNITTIIRIKNKNIYFLDYFEKMYDITFAVGNEIQLFPKTSYITGEVIFDDSEDIGKINSIEYSIDGQTLKSYTEKFFVSPNTDIYIKLNYSSKRIKISKELSGLDSSVIIYPLKFNPITNSTVNENIQFIQLKINQSKDLKFFITKNTFKINLFEDLNGCISSFIVGNTTEVEYTDEVIIKFELTKNQYISLRDLNKADDNIEAITNNYLIGFYDAEKYESSIYVGQSLNENILLGDKSQYSELDSEIRMAEKSLHAKCITNREGKSFFYSSVNTYTKNLNLELCFYVFRMPENEISIRLTSDYIRNSKLFDVKELDEETVQLNKSCYIRYIGSGGNTGNGSDGSSPPTTATAINPGGCGSSGFIGGNGGNGASTSGFSLYIEKDPDNGLKLDPVKIFGINFYIKPRLKLQFEIGSISALTGVGGLAGAGFYRGGTPGKQGAMSLVASSGQSYYNAATTIKPTPFIAENHNFSTGVNEIIGYEKFDRKDSNSFHLSSYKGALIDCILYINRFYKKKQMSTALYTWCGTKGNDGTSSSLPFYIGSDDLINPDGYYHGLKLTSPILKQSTGEWRYPFTDPLYAKEKGNWIKYPRLLSVSGTSASGAHAGYPTLLSLRSSTNSIVVEKTSSSSFLIKSENNSDEISNIILGGGIDGDTNVCSSSWEKQTYRSQVHKSNHNPLGSVNPPKDWSGVDLLEKSFQIKFGTEDTSYGKGGPFYSYSYLITPPCSLTNGGIKNNNNRIVPYYEYFLSNFLSDDNLYFQNGLNRKYGDGCGNDSLHIQKNNNYQRYSSAIVKKNVVTQLNSNFRNIFVSNSKTLIIPPCIKENPAIIEGPVNFNSFKDTIESHKKSSSYIRDNIRNASNYVKFLEQTRTTNGSLFFNAASTAIYLGPKKITNSDTNKINLYHSNEDGSITSFEIDGRNWCYSPNEDYFANSID